MSQLALNNPQFYSNLVSSHELLKTQARPLKTPLQRLNHFLKSFQFQGHLSEWGVPYGSISRLLPAMIAKALNKECLWISDKKQMTIYPNSWTGLGFDLNNIHFLSEQEPLSSLRTLIHENSFPFLIVDSQQFLQKSDFHFLAQATREYGLSIFLFRSFFLSNKNGNPFCRYRLNSSYCITGKRFELSVVKGPKKRRLNLGFNEVLCGSH